MTNPRSLLILLLLVLGCGLLANFAALAVWIAAGLDIQTIQTATNLEMSDRISMRIGLMINHAGMFLLPALLYAYIFYKNKFVSFTHLDDYSELKQYLIWGAMVVVSYPLIAWLTTVNMALPLPDWMRSSQEQTFALLGNTLQMDNIGELLMNILLVGVLAAAGEELIFRGILQRQMESLFSNPHIAVWGAALLFGGIHFQAERLFPLMTLGLALGYSYYYSRSLWVPIILHFLNNSFQVLSLYVVKEENLPDLDHVPDIPIVVVIISVVLIAVLSRIAVAMSPINDKTESLTEGETESTIYDEP